MNHHHLALLACICLGAAADARSQEATAPPPVKAGLADVTFMAGHWLGGDPGELSKEV